MNNNRILTIFRRLAKRDSQLVRISAEETRGKDEARYGIMTSGRPADRAPSVPETLLRQWVSEGLIERSGEGFRISAAGLSWLRRRLASSDEFQAQHQKRTARVIDFEGVKRHAIVNEPDSPLRWLASRKDKNGDLLLAPFQLEAGERLRSDYEFAGLTGKTTANWDAASQSGASGGGQNEAAALQDNVLAARQRVVRALGAVGPELAGILVDVCCHGKGLEAAEKTEGWPQRSGKVVLQIALTRLARHYGLVSDDAINNRVRRKLTHWGMEDYRPKVDGGSAGS